MPLFISHSHKDNQVVESIARQLIKKQGINVWIDLWELNTGDSLIGKIQSAIDSAFALAIVISKESMQSKWCSEELNAGLLKELEEKRIFVLPILLEKCEMPIFLRGKMYADFTKSFDQGINQLSRSLSKFDNILMSRYNDEKYYTDWGIEYSSIKEKDDLYGRIIVSAIQQNFESKYSCLYEFELIFNGELNKKFLNHIKSDTTPIFSRLILSIVARSFSKQDREQIYLDSPKRVEKNYELSINGEVCLLVVTVRWMGTNTGMYVVVDIPGLLENLFAGFEEYCKQFVNPEIMKAFNQSNL